MAGMLAEPNEKKYALVYRFTWIGREDGKPYSKTFVVSNQEELDKLPIKSYRQLGLREFKITCFAEEIRNHMSFKVKRIEGRNINGKFI